jgi:hypothetical protein
MGQFGRATFRCVKGVHHGNSDEKSSSSPSGLIFSGDGNPLGQPDAPNRLFVSDVQPQGQCFENLAKAIGKYGSTIFMLDYEQRISVLSPSLRTARGVCTYRHDQPMRLRYCDHQIFWNIQRPIHIAPVTKLVFRLSSIQNPDDTTTGVSM